MANKINKDYASTINTTALKGRKIEYIVIHYTAGTKSYDGKAKESVKNFALATRSASADFVVDDGDVVYQYNKDIANRYTWSVGGSKYSSCSWSGGGKFYGKCTNKNSISIEMCSSKLDGGKSYSSSDTDWYVTEKVWENTVELTKDLMKKYGVDEAHVIRHWEVVGKECPAFMCYTRKQKYYNDMTGNELWDKFKSELKVTPTPSVSPDTTIPLKITSNVEAIQKWANTYYLDCFKDVVGKLDVDGSCGAKTKGAITLILKNELKKLGATDINLKNTNLGSGIKNGLNKYGVVKKGSTGIFVTLAQALLVCKKYDPNGIDGKAGNGFDTAIRKFQKDKKLTQDGSCGAISWTNLLA